MNPTKTQFLCTSLYPEPISFEGCRIEPSQSIKWLGCILTPSGAAKEHVEHRLSLALAAWQLLNRQFCFQRLRFKVKARLYKAVLEPIMLHGLNAYALTTSEIQKILKTQNMVQRTFVGSRAGDVHERWVEIHARLRLLRTERKLSNSAKVVLERYARKQYSQETLAIIDFRGMEWKRRLERRINDRRRQGRPALSLQSLPHGYHLSHEDESILDE